MRASAVVVAAAVVLAFAGRSHAGELVGGKVQGLLASRDGGAPHTFTCDQKKAVAAYCAHHGVAPDEGGQVLQVCINDFTYYPPIVTPREGDVVAWVNVEKCADPAGGPVNVVEGIFADVLGAGCDTHHEVVTLPDESAFNAEDTLNARICSRYPSIEPKPGTPPVPDLAIDPGSCPGHEDETGNMTPVLQQLAPSEDTGVITPTNVFCHKFTNVGAQHYTCFANPAHSLVLHGGILVLPAGSAPLPELPDQPQL